MTNSDWLVVGARVATLGRPHHDRPRLAYSTVTKILKRDIVLENGDRFNVETRTRRVGGTWGHNVHLLPADDPQVVTTAAELEQLRIKDRARDAARAFDDGKASAVEVIRALAPLTDIAPALLALLDETASAGSGPDQS